MRVPVYTFYLHQDKNAVPSFEIVHFDDQGRAMAHGKKLLRDRPRYSSVEVTLEDESLAKFTRNDI